MFRGLFAALALIILCYPAQGQENRKISISFLPPPLETATYSLGIYSVKSGLLVRRLQESATQDAFIVGLNGLITNWDGKDDAGKAVPPGKYAARGYASGALKVEGVDILGNDWANDDEKLRVKRVHAILLVPVAESLGVLAMTGRWEFVQVFCWMQAGREDAVGRQTLLTPPEKEAEPPDASTCFLLGNDEYLSRWGRKSLGHQVDQIADGQIFHGELNQGMDKAGAFSSGKNGSVWKIEGGVLEPVRISLWRKATCVGGETGRTRPRRGVRCPERGFALSCWRKNPDGSAYAVLSWVETREEAGKPVSTWQTFFERNVRPPDPTLGLDGPTAPVEINLVENPLDPGKPQKVKLGASYDDEGSYLTTADGLRLRRISQRVNLEKVKLVKGKSATDLTFFQNDGAAWDEFSIEGARNMMAFDAGEIDMTADGEKDSPRKSRRAAGPLTRGRVSL